jgi:hypothetical protein
MDSSINNSQAGAKIENTEAGIDLKDPQTGGAKFNQLLDALCVTGVKRPTSDTSAIATAQVIKTSWSEDPRRLQAAAQSIETSCNELSRLTQDESNHPEDTHFAKILVKELCAGNTDLEGNKEFCTITERLATSMS